MAQLVKYLSLRHEDRHRGPQDPCKADTSGSEHCFPRAFQNIYYRTHSPFASISINTVHSPDLCVCQRQLEMPRAGVRVQMQLPGSPAPVYKFMYQNPAAAPHCQDSALTDQSHWESCCWKRYVRPGQGHLASQTKMASAAYQHLSDLHDAEYKLIPAFGVGRDERNPTQYQHMAKDAIDSSLLWELALPLLFAFFFCYNFIARYMNQKRQNMKNEHKKGSNQILWSLKKEVLTIKGQLSEGKGWKLNGSWKQEDREWQSVPLSSNCRLVTA